LGQGAISRSRVPTPGSLYTHPAEGLLVTATFHSIRDVDGKIDVMVDSHPTLGTSAVLRGFDLGILGWFLHVEVEIFFWTEDDIVKKLLIFD